MIHLEMMQDELEETIDDADLQFEDANSDQQLLSVNSADRVGYNIHGTLDVCVTGGSYRNLS